MRTWRAICAASAFIATTAVGGDVTVLTDSEEGFLAAPLVQQPPVEATLEADRLAFAEFERRFRKTYTDGEREARFAAFKANCDLIRTTNAEGRSYTLGLTAYADLTQEEFRQMYGMAMPASSKEVYGDLPLLGMHEYRNLTVPAAMDWRAHGAVTGVKNQGQCGACWAFSSTGALEGAWHIATGQLPSLSEQQLVDCSAKYHNLGCHGGNTPWAFDYAKEVTTGMCNEASYPYEASNGACRTKDCRVGIPPYGVSGWKAVKEGDESGLLEAVAQQPVTVAIEADTSTFQLYTSGILGDKPGKVCYAKNAVDHSVLVVGYGTEGGKDYWLLKNSWGPHWGESGYVRLARGTAGDGECGLKNMPVYPVVDGSRAQPPDVTETLVALGITLAGGVAIGAYCCCARRGSRARAALTARQVPLHNAAARAQHGPSPQQALQAASCTQAPAPPGPGGNSRGSRLVG